MVLFNEVKEEFEKHNCKLLMTEEEFNQKTRTTKEKYKYTASCGDNHEIIFQNIHIFNSGESSFVVNYVYLL